MAHPSRRRKIDGIWVPQRRCAYCSPILRAILAGAVAVALIAPLSSNATRAVSSEKQFERAVALRTELEATPPGQRTRQGYEAALDSFRLVYHQDPGAAKAPAAVAATADLLAEKGRVLGDPKALRAAIGQYEFLRKQYPRSPQVANALLLEGEICRQDLKDLACAEDKLRAVLTAQPDTSFAEQAALELNGLKDLESKPTKPNHPEVANPDPKPTQPDRLDKLDKLDVGASPTRAALAAPAANAANAVSSSGGPGGRRVTITGMRHWSNPTSTRIAIDLDGKVAYEAARVPNPDRIFFDLHGTRLATGWSGHPSEAVEDGYLKRIRVAQFQPGVTRVVLDVSDVTGYSAFLLPNPWRLIIDIHSDKAPGKAESASARPAGAGSSQAAQPSPAAVGRLGGVSGDNTVADVARLSSEPAEVRATDGPTSEPVSARVGTKTADAAQPGQAGGQPANAPGPAARGRRNGRNHADEATASTDTANDGAPHAADPTSDGQRSLVRALGLKVGRIVIDAGHGGHDSGTLGPGGIEEKDVVLDVALRTGRLLHQRLGAEIVYTRDDDTFIPLETRTAIANKAQADLFLSIHGNSSPEPEARGVEAYYLNFTSDPNALDVAARENALSNHSVHQLSDLVRKITLKDKIDESREFAADMDAALYAGLKAGNPGLKDRGVKKAPFVVLIGAQMPSVLTEISFLTNPNDARQLAQASYRERIAEALDAGVERYLRGLSGTRPPLQARERAKSSAEIAARAGEEPAGR